jgi:hypothetical protein
VAAQAITTAVGFEETSARQHSLKAARSRRDSRLIYSAV